MKRVKMINTLGTDMWITEDRVEEYQAAGHVLAADLVHAEERPTEKKPRRTRKKTEA